MGHYLNNYFEAHALIEVAKVSKVHTQLFDAESTKSFTMAEANRLKQAIKELEEKLSSKTKRREAEKESYYRGISKIVRHQGSIDSGGPARCGGPQTLR